ncbi:MAG: HIT family protein, partial [Candidatus Thiodiazotropha sp. 6PLUC3]
MTSANPPFELDPRLATDCYLLAELELSQLLLMNNALLPWFILVPRVSCHELHQLSSEQQLILLQETNLLSHFVETNYETDKLNIAAIGNIVRQMHIHIIGRTTNDPWWPGVVWGTSQRQAYDQSQLDEIIRKLEEQLPDTLCFLH